LENLRKKEPEVGEKIRMTTYARERDDGVKVLHAEGSTPYLLVASESRQNEYDNLRFEVGGGIDKLRLLSDDGEYEQARSVFAQLRGLELTKRESEEILLLMLGFPKGERPVFDGDKSKSSWVSDLDEAYRVSVESMTRDEFEQFARDVGSGRREPLEGESCDESGVYLVMSKNNYDDATMLSVLAEAIDERLKRLEQVERKHEYSFSDKYVLTQALIYLSEIGLPEATRKILSIVRYAMDHKYYYKRRNRDDDLGCPHNFTQVLWSATENLVGSVVENPGNVYGIEDLSELMAWREELLPYPLCDSIVNNLQRVIDLFRVA